MKYTQVQVEEFKAMIALTDDDAVTTSNKVASYFSKRHYDVMLDIRKMMKDIPEFSQRNFSLSNYTNSRGKNYESFNITKDGFVMLAMGFTGKKAMEWKVKYINAFNWLVESSNTMQKELDEFSRIEASSVSNGSYHGKGLQQRKVEKGILEVKEIELKNKWQPLLLGIK